MNIIRLYREVLISKEICIEWCVAKKLFPAHKVCNICGSEMSMNYDHGFSGRFRCQKLNKHNIFKKRTIAIQNVEEVGLYIDAFCREWSIS